MVTAAATKLKTAQWCSLTSLFTNDTYEVVVIGKEAIAKNKEPQKKYLPDCVVMGSRNEENLSLLESKWTENKTLIYVCTNKVCKRPVEDVTSALKQLNQANAF